MFQCALSGKSLVRMRRASPLARKVVINKVIDRGESSQLCCSGALLAAFKMPKQVAYNARGASQRGLKLIFSRAIMPRIIGADDFLRVVVRVRKRDEYRGILRPVE